MRFTFEQAWNRRVGTGWLSEAEARAMWNYMRLINARWVLEVGSYFGRSAGIFAAFLAEHDFSELIACDPLADGHHFPMSDSDKAHEAMRSIYEIVASFGMANRFTFHRKRDAELFQEFTSQGGCLFNLIYLDGDHTYEATLDSIERWSQCLHPNGVMLIHDYAESGGGLAIKHAIEHSGKVIVHDVVERLAICLLKEE